MNHALTATELKSALTGTRPPIVIDVRRTPAFRAAPDMIEGALRRDPDAVSSWGRQLPRAARFVVYCVHGHEVSQTTAKVLRGLAMDAQFLEGGLDEGWRAAGGALMEKPKQGPTRWITRERPKIDRIACPWLVARFVDPDAEFLYVPAQDVLSKAKEKEAVPYDIPDVRFSHEGELCSFDAFLECYRLSGDPALAKLAAIVRGADTAKLDLTPQSAGLHAISLGLSHNFRDDHEMLSHGMVMYDTLYAWCRQGQDEAYTWNAQAHL